MSLIRFRALSVAVLILLYSVVSRAEDGATLPAWIDQQLAEEELSAVLPPSKVAAAKLGSSVFTLEEAVEFALKHNHVVRQAKEKLTEAYGNFLTERSFSLPQLEGSGTYRLIEKGRVPQFQGLPIGTDETWNGSALVRQQIYAGGELAARRRRAELGQEFARLAYESVRQDVARSVRDQFYAVLLASEGIQVARESVQLLQEELRLEQNRREAGTVSDFNVIRAEAELSNAQTPLIRARNQLRIGLEELVLRIGFTPDDRDDAVGKRLQLVGELTDRPVVLDLSGALAKAEADRPDLKQLQVQVKAAGEGVKIATAGYLPQLSVRGGYGADSLRFAEGSTMRNEGWEVGAELSWKIFDSYGTEGRKIQAESVENQAAIQVAQKKEQIKVEVRRAMSQVVEAKELVTASEKAIRQAEESFRLARSRAEVGAALQIDVLDARVALIQSKLNRAEALYRLNASLAELDRAVGLATDQLAKSNGSKESALVKEDVEPKKTAKVKKSADLQETEQPVGAMPTPGGAEPGKSGASTKGER